MAQQVPWMNRQGVEAFNAQGYKVTPMRYFNKDGKQLHHHTWFNPQTDRRISYDTYDAGWGVGHVYVEGSGHEVGNRSGQVVDRWDGNTRYERYDPYGNVAEVVFGG